LISTLKFTRAESKFLAKLHFVLYIIEELIITICHNKDIKIHINWSSYRRQRNLEYTFNSLISTTEIVDRLCCIISLCRCSSLDVCKTFHLRSTLTTYIDISNATRIMTNVVQHFYKLILLKRKRITIWCSEIYIQMNLFTFVFQLNILFIEKHLLLFIYIKYQLFIWYTVNNGRNTVLTQRRRNYLKRYFIPCVIALTFFRSHCASIDMRPSTILSVHYNLG
jgi:hypothetical protein